MAKLTAGVVTVIGVLMAIALWVDNPEVMSLTSGWLGWLITIGVLVIGVGKLIRNYSYKKRK